MADTLKAVIRAEVDPSGVVSGVNRATTELQKLNRTATSGATSAGITATLNVLQTAYQVVSGIVGKLADRAKTLTDITTRFDLGAANAKTRFEVEQIKANRRIAAALSPAVQESFRMQTAAVQAEAARVESGAAGIGQGIVAATQGQIIANQVGTTAGDAALQGGGWLRNTLTDIVDKLRSPN